MPDTPRPNPAELYQDFYGPGIFGPMAQRFVPFAGPSAGHRALDVACGTGIVARSLASRVGADGAVVAVDLNPAMIEVAQRQPAPAGATIEWRVGDAVELDHDLGTFDLVTCQHGLQFFSDRPRFLDQARRTIASGGAIAIAVWQDVSRQTLLAELAEVEARWLEPLGVSYDDRVAPFSLGDADEVARLLGGAGYVEVEVVEQPFEARLAADDFIRRMETAYAAVIPAFQEHPEAFEAFVAEVEREATPLVERYTDGELVRFPMPVILARATVA